MQKIGGIGDYILGLCLNLIKQTPSLDLHVFLPLYKTIDRSFLSSLSIKKTKLAGTYNLETTDNEVWTAPYRGMTLHLFKMKDPENFFTRNTIYGDRDDTLRFLNYSILALQYLKDLNLPIDIVHLHDWLTAFIAPLFKEKYFHLGVKIKAIITTIHNAGYQGSFPKNDLKKFGLCTQLFDVSEKLQDPKKCSHFNLLKGALFYSDALTTVSPTYNEEIQSDFGMGLESYFRKFQDKLTPILNGIDTDYWNINNDALLHTTTASIKNMTMLTTFKQKCKNYLIKELNLPLPIDKPLFCTVTRLVEQKGPELIAQAIDYFASHNIAFIILGTPIDQKTKLLFETLKTKHENNPLICFKFGFDEALAHNIFAGADFTLIPSLFEPCGLTQMIALRYGTLPLVHHVGGLKDTIHDAHSSKTPQNRNGYVFTEPKAIQMTHCIQRAIQDFSTNQSLIHELMWNGFTHDWSWDKSAKKHTLLYKNCCPLNRSALSPAYGAVAS